MSRRRPAPPAVVFDRRYGDCKDKAALLVAMLRAGRIDARPALVSTSYGRSLDAWSPSPMAFDHVIARVQRKHADTLWIDATETLQGGGIDRMRYLPFERALTLDGMSTTLEQLPQEPQEDPSPYVHDEFRVGVPGTDQPTRIDSVHEYRDQFADYMRTTFRSLTKEQIRKHYVSLYQQDYPTIRDEGELEISDDRPHDRLRVVAHFVVPGFWTAPSAETPYTAQIAARMIDSGMPRPPTTDRSAPLGLAFPYRVRYEVDASLPFDLQIEPQTLRTDSDGFSFAFQSSGGFKHLAYTFDLEHKAAEVKAAELARYSEAVDRVRGHLLRNITYRLPTPDSPNWPLIALLGLTVPASAWGARRAYLYNPVPRTPKDPDPRLAGFRGWLSFLGIILLLQPVICLWKAATLVPYVVSRAKWAALGSGTGGHSPWFGATIATMTVLLLVMAAYSGTLIAIYLGRRRSFPLHLTVVFGLLGGIGIGDKLLAPAPAQYTSNMVGILIGTTIWITYVHVSRRVAATFVE